MVLQFGISELQHVGGLVPATQFGKSELSSRLALLMPTPSNECEKPLPSLAVKHVRKRSLHRAAAPGCSYRPIAMAAESRLSLVGHTRISTNGRRSTRMLIASCLAALGFLTSRRT